ncbi:MAG: hypothetical protein PHZ02_03310 [Desulfocapsaceae bacterium]|nr:hypothetical protein [Desulfocapsaceae bacterium]
MRTNTQTRNETKIDTGYETSKFAMATGFTMAALVGIWACACMISGLVSGGLVQGLITAITGV